MCVCVFNAVIVIIVISLFECTLFMAIFDKRKYGLAVIKEMMNSPQRLLSGGRYLTCSSDSLIR